MDHDRLDAWAAAHRRGDEDAFRLLVEALTRRLVATAYRYVGDWDAARDLTQDTWLRVHQSIREWDPSRPVGPWIFTIHRHLCLDHLRRRPRTERIGDRVGERIAGPSSDPWIHLTQNELLARIRQALTGLSEVQRRILTMVDLEEMGPAEVAATTGMNPTTVRTTLHFARRKLARILGKETP